MDAKLLAAALCQQYQIQPTSGGGLSVVTPLRYDDGDHVVIFVSVTASGYQVDDNGEAAVRLMHDGVDLDGGRVRQWLDSLPHVHGVSWDDGDEHLCATTGQAGSLPGLVMRVAECSVQMQALRGEVA